MITSLAWKELVTKKQSDQTNKSRVCVHRITMWTGIKNGKHDHYLAPYRHARHKETKGIWHFITDYLAHFSTSQTETSGFYYRAHTKTCLLWWWLTISGRINTYPTSLGTNWPEWRPRPNQLEAFKNTAPSFSRLKTIQLNYETKI